MSERPLSPITERSSFSSSRSDPSPPSPVVPTRRRPPPPLREISYESEREGESGEDGDDNDSLYSQRSSGETVTPARILEGEVVQVENTSMVLPSPVDRMTMARPLPVRGISPSITPRASTPSTPASINFTEVPLPGGLLPPPRSKRDLTPFPHPIKSENRHGIKRKSHIDPYPGGREVINLDQDTDDEDYDTRSVATATTAGIAGVGAGDRVRGDEMTGKMEVEKVQNALRGIMEEQEQAIKRYRDHTPTPTPPRSRPTSFFYDQSHPTLHNIPRFPSPPPEPVDPALLSPTLLPRVRTPSKLFKSPPPSRPVSRPGSIKGDKGTEREGTAEVRARPSTYHAGMPLPEGNGWMGTDNPDVRVKDLTLHDALDLDPANRQTIESYSPDSSQVTPNTDIHKLPKSKSTITLDNTRSSKTPPSTKTKRRTSRIIPNVLISLFSDTPSERKRETEAIHTVTSAQKVKVEPGRAKSRLAKPRRLQSEGASSKLTPGSLDPPLTPEAEMEVKVPENAIRKSGTFGVRDDGSEVFQSDGASALPVGLGLKGSSKSRTAVTEGFFPLVQPIDAMPPVPLGMHRPRTGSFRTIDTQGTARTFAPDKNRGLYAADAEKSLDDLPTEKGGGVAVEDVLPPISERSCASHETATRIDHTATDAIGTESPRTPELRTPELNIGVSAVTPPLPVPPTRDIQFSPVVVDDGHDRRIARHYGQLGNARSDQPEPSSVKAGQGEKLGSIQAVTRSDQRLSPRNNKFMMDEAVQTSTRSSPRRRLPSVPSIPYSTTPAADADGARQRRTSLPSARPSVPPVVTNGLPPLPESLQGYPSLLHTRPEDLPLLIASHLLASHASSLMYQSTTAKGLSEEMYRLAETSLEWGKVLMDMANKQGGAGSQGGTESDDLALDGGENRGVPGGYDGMPRVSEPLYAEDAYTRLPVRREPKVPYSPFSSGPQLNLDIHPGRHNPTHKATFPQSAPRPSPSSPIPTYLHPSITSPRPGKNFIERHKKAESLPPDWFRRVQDLGSAGWDNLHSAEQVWRESVADQAGMWSGLAGGLETGAAGGAGRTGLLGVENASKGMTSQEYVALEPLDPARRGYTEDQQNDTAMKGRPTAEEDRSTGSKKLVKQPSSKKIVYDSGTSRSGAGGSVHRIDVGPSIRSQQGKGKADIGTDAEADGAGEQAKKSRWWRRKG